MKTIIIASVASLFSLSLSAQAYKGAANKQTPEQQLNELYCSGLFKSTEGTILDVASDISSRGYLNILDWLQGRVAGLQIFTSRTGISYPVMRGNIPAIYVDEIQVNASFLNFLNVNDIGIIKVIKTPFYGGFNGAGGAIAIYTLALEGDEEEIDSK